MHFVALYAHENMFMSPPHAKSRSTEIYFKISRAKMAAALPTLALCLLDEDQIEEQDQIIWEFWICPWLQYRKQL